MPAYKDALGHERVYYFGLLRSHKLHNPIATLEVSQCLLNFAGSYYWKSATTGDFTAIIDAVSAFKPVEIYDRNFGRDHAHYKFPEEYQSLILGKLPFHQIDKAYKGYRYGINMNSVKQSQRDVVALTCVRVIRPDTVVVSNFSRGVRTMFGDPWCARIIENTW